MEIIIKKIINKESITDEEVNLFLKTICEAIRKDCKINNPMDSDCKKCSETSIKFGRYMAMKCNCEVEIIDIKEMLQIPLTHYANIIYFNVNGNKKTYLVDMTYSQFFEDSIALDVSDNNNVKVVSTKDSFNKIKEELFVEKLRQNGFIELKSDILTKYVDAFLNLCNVKKKHI